MTRQPRATLMLVPLRGHVDVVQGCWRKVRKTEHPRAILNGPEGRCEVPHAHATGSVGFRAPILLISLALGV